MKPHIRIFENKRVALPILTREFGLICAVSTVVRTQKASFEGAPYKELPEPEDADEEECREQIGPAILLYRELQRMTEPERALAITREIVREAGLHFLRHRLRKIDLVDLVEMDHATRLKTAKQMTDQFANADVRWDRVDHRRAEFTVTRCRFPRICKLCDAPELASIFCEIDRDFFQERMPNVMVQRDQSIAMGGSCCPFKLYWAEPGAPPQ